VTQVFAPVLTFAVFSVRARDTGDKTLDTARVFTSLSLFALLSEPISSLVMSLATFLGAVGSFTRIQQFLQSDERVDNRSLDESNMPKVAADGEKLASADAITVRNADFGWDPAKEPLLKSITMSVPWRKLTMIVGPVGCGKSTLLNGLLGEIPTLAGSVRIGSSSVAYCAQNPWHMNGTVRHAIVGSAPFDQRWYNRVVKACALRPDFRQLPMGDASCIGSGGIALSGGQSQRIVGYYLRLTSYLHFIASPLTDFTPLVTGSRHLCS
jgi:ABC-type bacteriocin/lantibiotic exporter with double-glycine peptidase domain